MAEFEMRYPDEDMLAQVLMLAGKVGGKVARRNVVKALTPAIETIVRREVGHEPRGTEVEEAQRRYRLARKANVRGDLCHCLPSYQDSRSPHPVHGRGTNPRCVVTAAALELAEALTPGA